MTILRVTGREEYILRFNTSKVIERVIVKRLSLVMTELTKKRAHGGIERIVLGQLSPGAQDDPNKWEYVSKRSYPLNGRVHGADVIFRALKALKTVDADLSESRCRSKKYTDSLPRVYDEFEIDNRNKIFRAFYEPNSYGERVLRFIVSERLEPITSLTNLEKFKTTIRDMFHDYLTNLVML